ncbi:hypothetical protein JK358_07840 [Nocardia sp. 2]|uniref:Uncharacterized protein n=1 Tax=Nocardia acididurans TaxID=2802282 RepID=A0ABS1M1A4_9NOCA|nr:hypothetical protein [Nocardia acididurans]MBL1074306.1 hypothetical protein [Nocardia acididurans]
MPEHTVPWRRITLWTATLAAVTAWTALAAYSVILGTFLATDTRCGSTTPEVDMEGGWWVIVTLLLWSAPFAAYAIRRRTPLSITAATLTLTVSTLIILRTLTTPTTFCW